MIRLYLLLAAQQHCLYHLHMEQLIGEQEYRLKCKYFNEEFRKLPLKDIEKALGEEIRKALKDEIPNLGSTEI